jgi:hypothetical protein
VQKFPTDGGRREMSKKNGSPSPLFSAVAMPVLTLRL